MVWIGSKYFGVGKATSNTGKIFVVAYYYPAGINWQQKKTIFGALRFNKNIFWLQFWLGNVVNAFHENVLFPILDDHDNPKSPKDSDNNPIAPILKVSGTH